MPSDNFVEEIINKTAAQNGIRYLYHWEKFVPEYIDQTLRTNRIHFSNPSKFNDPWDCKPFYDTSDCYDSVGRMRLLDWVVYICKTRTDRSDSEIQQLRTDLDNNPDKLEKTINEISEKNGVGIDQLNRVYCLGVDPKNILMWSHYAESHSGICYEFNVTNFNYIGAALKCDYLADYPKLEIHNNSDGHQLKPILSKADVWAYENEYRIVSEEKLSSNTPGMIITENSFLQLQDNSIASIIVGCRGKVDEVKQLVEGANSSIVVKTAKMVKNRYEIEIV
jgi:hypothetical protein